MIVRSVAEAKAARGRWEATTWSRMDADLDFFLAVVAARREVLRPHAVFAEDGPSALVARLEVIQLATSIGYRTVYEPTVRALTVVHGGIVGADSDAGATALVDELIGALARGEADVAELPAVPVASATYRAAVTRPGFLCRQHLRETSVHRRLLLPASFDEFLASRSKKTRERVRRYTNRLIRDHGATLEVEVLRRPEDLERIIRDAEEVAAKTYQRGLGVAFGDAPERRSLAELGLRRGWFRMWLLYLDGKPVAFWPGYAYNRGFFIGTPGYDPRFAELRLGQFVLMRMIEDLCEDDGIDALDYGFGDSDYKRQFSNESWEESDLRIFAPTLRAVRVNATTTAIKGTARLARRVIGHERVARIKKGWRGRLERSG